MARSRLLLVAWILILGASACSSVSPKAATAPKHSSRPKLVPGPAGPIETPCLGVHTVEQAYSEVGGADAFVRATVGEETVKTFPSEGHGFVPVERDAPLSDVRLVAGTLPNGSPQTLVSNTPSADENEATPGGDWYLVLGHNPGDPGRYHAYYGFVIANDSASPTCLTPGYLMFQPHPEVATRSSDLESLFVEAFAKKQASS
jgi:hypothetical protein